MTRNFDKLICGDFLESIIWSSLDNFKDIFIIWTSLNIFKDN